jgi:hypothetical protein
MRVVGVQDREPLGFRQGGRGREQREGQGGEGNGGVYETSEFAIIQPNGDLSGFQAGPNLTDPESSSKAPFSAASILVGDGFYVLGSSANCCNLSKAIQVAPLQ